LIFFSSTTTTRHPLNSQNPFINLAEFDFNSILKIDKPTVEEEGHFEEHFFPVVV
jgi:hypothetical protein